MGARTIYILGALLVLVSLATTSAMAAELVPIADPTSGRWTGLKYGSVELSAGPSEDLSIEGEQAGQRTTAARTEVRVVRQGARTVLSYRSGDWMIDDVMTRNGAAVRRRIHAQWEGAATAVVTGVTLRTPILRLSPSTNDWALLPGNFPIRKIRLAAMTDGERATESGWTRGDYALAMLHSPTARISVVAGYAFRGDEARVSVERLGNGLVLEHRFHALARLEPGDSMEIGEQVLRAIPGPESALRRGVANLSDHLDNGPPGDTPTDIGRTVLYEVHPWGRLEIWGVGDRGYRYDRLTRLLPYYKRLGINAFWLLPVSWPPPWVYTLPAFDRIAPENGTPEQLKGFVDGAHALGMRVLMDLVVYGIHPDSEEAAKLPPDVWARDRNGQPTRVWGGAVLAADTSAPAWQARIRQVCDAWVRQFGFDGARLDCIGWGQTPNWAAARPNRAMAEGGLQLNKVVREAFRAVNPRSLLLPEGGKPLVFRNADMIFDYPLYLAMRDMTLRPDLSGWIADLQAWLEWERLCYPRRAQGIVRFLELHDTVASTEYFGAGPAQALTAICVFLHGVPLLQQDQEIGFSADLAAWLHLRDREPRFWKGGARYDAVRSSDARIWTCLREGAEGAAVIGVNLTGADINTRLRWPADIARAYPSGFNGLSGQAVAVRDGAVDVVVPAYRPFVLLLNPRGVRPKPIRPVRATGRRWTVRTSEGVLSDIVQDYATGSADRSIPLSSPKGDAEEVLPTLRRARNARELGLMDGVIPRSIAGGPVRVAVDPWFVRLTNDRLRLTLARRHGGIIAELARIDGKAAVPLIRTGGDAYADQGFFPDNQFGSVDGETNPRLSFIRSRDRVTVRFAGVLRSRSWNGVQTCAIAGPLLRYELAYSMDASNSILITMTLTSPTDRTPGQSFFALRLPIGRLTGWSRGANNGAVDEASQGRLGQGALSEPLELQTRNGRLTATPGPGMRNLFAIGGATTDAHLFLALADGPLAAMEANQPLRAECALTVGAEEPSDP